MLLRVNAVDEDPGGTSRTAVEIGVLVVIAGGSAVGAAQTSKTTAVLGFVGVLLVAVITAVTTNRRQERQIAAAAEAQERAVAAERERLVVQLEHDRTLADRADLRGLLDEAAQRLRDADASCRDTLLGLQLHAHELDAYLPDALRRLEVVGNDLDGLATRMRIRLASHEPTLVAFEAATEAVLDVFRRVGVIARLRDDRQLDTDVDAIGLAADRFAERARTFFAAAVDRVGTAVSS